MRALEQTLVFRDDGLLDDTPVAALSVLAVGWLAALVALPAPAARVVGLAAAHGALIGTALAWTAPARPERWAPHPVAILTGATFYLALLGAGNCVLLVRTGSLVAPLSAGIVFFAAYRLLTV